MSLVPATILERPLNERELATALLNPVKQMLHPDFFLGSATCGCCPAQMPWEREDILDFILAKFRTEGAPALSPYWKN